MTAGVDEVRLAELRMEMMKASERLIRRRRTRRVTAAAVIMSGIVAGAGIAATVRGDEVTPAEIDRTATIVENDLYLDCSSIILGCVQKMATHRQADVVPVGEDRPIGVTFVLSDGTRAIVVPASGLGPALPTRRGSAAVRAGLGGIDENGLFHPGNIRRRGGAVEWSVALRSGGTRTIRWWRSTGRIEMTTKRPGEHSQTLQLRAGDVVEVEE